MKKLISRLAILVIAVVLIIPQTGCAGKSEPAGNSEPVSKQSFYFDTTCQVTIYDMKDMTKEKAESTIDEAFQECQKYENLLSKTKKGTDVYRLNHAGGAVVECDPLTVKVIQMGLDYAKLTKGQFDISIGTVVDLWDYHDEKAVPPTSSKVSEALKHTGYRLIAMDGNKVQLKDEKMEIDLGGIAKGYIADAVSSFLKKKGVTSAIVSLGGNIECIGDKFGQDFVIGIEKPYSDQSEIVGSTPLSNGTIVTSGTYERFFEYKGKKYHHILSSKTGYPVDTDVVGVSIKGPAGHSVDCDGLSTTCLILGSKEGKKLIESKDGYEALFILEDGSKVKTKGFEYTEE